MSEQNYHPVSCDFHDDLEAIVKLKKQAVITFRDATGGEQMIRGHVVDLFTQNHEEFLKMSDGMTVRLDKVTSVNGKNSSSYRLNS